VERLERFERLERTGPYDEPPHPGRSGTRAALELLEPMEPYVSDHVLNGAQRLNGLNDLNATASFDWIFLAKSFAIG
jgi:hypothetical protein